jgi:cytochrome c oxidase subunit III
MEAAIPAHGHADAHADTAANDHKVKIGMGYYVIVDVIFVIFLFVAYVWLRAYDVGGGWFPSGTKLPDATTTNILTGVMVVSGIAYYIGYLGIRRGSQAQLSISLVVATVLTIVALVWQLHFMANLPFVTIDGSFASAYILLAGYHAYHLMLGTFLGLGVTHRALRGRYSRDRMLGVITVGYYWYWMAAMPVLVWLLMLVLPPKI